MTSTTRSLITILIAGLAAAGLSDPLRAQTRSPQTDDRMPEFVLTDVDEAPVASASLRDRAWFLTFLTAHQRRSERALDDLAKLVAEHREAGHLVDLLIVISGGEGPEFFRRKHDMLPPGTRLLLDPDDALWGRLHVVVTPTSFLVDAEGMIRWARAGHSFDFATRARDGLDRALGLSNTPAAVGDPAEPNPAETNDAPERAWRHLRMTRVLARRGEIEPAIAEIRKARALTPGAFEVETELAQLLCRSGQPDTALAVVVGLKPSAGPDRARVAMLTGWALRLRGDSDRAVPLLEEAITLDPNSGRALYELGRVFEERGDCGRALKLYRRALDLDFAGVGARSGSSRARSLRDLPAGAASPHYA